MSNVAGALMGIMIGITGVGTIVLVVVAIVQEGKMAGRGEAVKSAFTYIVSLVMLAIILVSSVYLLSEGARAWVFTKAQPSSYAYQAAPPVMQLFTDKVGIGQLYECKTDCQLTDTDRANFSLWKTQYQQWQQQSKDSVLTATEKRDIVTALSFLIVALPLFWWFFIRMAQRESKRYRAEHGKNSMLRTIYFYLFALTGLVATVVATALLINTGLRSAFKLQDTSNNGGTYVTPTIGGTTATDLNSANSIINCSDTCNISADDVALVKQWKTDYAAWQQKTMNPKQTSPTQSDLADYLPLLLVMVPVFLYHFLSIRRETASSDAPASPAPPATNA